MNCAFTSLGTLFLVAQAGFFICCTTTVGLFWGITILLKFHVPSRDFFLQSFAKFHCLWKCWRCLTYLPKMNLFPWTVFLPDGFENGIIQRFLTGDYMAWGSISLFAGFPEKENFLETLIVIFENVSPKGFFWLNMKNFEISVLTANSRYLQTAALNHEFITSRDLSVKVWSYSGQISMALFSCSLCR